MSRTIENFPQDFLENVRKPLITSVPLQDYSHFKIGGTADFFFEASSSQELVNAVLFVRDESVPYYVIGGGYNLLFDDDGFRGLIIKNGVKGIKKKEGIPVVEAHAGVTLGDLLRFCVEQGLGGLEFMAGIPGTLGGAVFGNAGAFEQSIGDFLEEALVLDSKGKQGQVGRDYFEFRYRHSLLKEKQDVLLSAVFELREEEGKTIRALIDRNLKKREKKHPPHDLPCAGSYFKNPVISSGERVPAAYFLEKVGAKTLKVGGASVYSGHANFIINQENASAQDVVQLAQELKRRVKETFDVELEEEVIFLPAGSSMP